MGKKTKEKKLQNEEINQILDVMKNSAKDLRKLIDVVCNKNPADDYKADGLIESVITAEKKVDRLKEDFIEKLFKKKGFLPTFQKMDNLRIVEKLDKIEDNMEVVARFFQIYDYNFPQEIKDSINLLGGEVTDVITALTETVFWLYKDFSKALEMTVKVQDERREAREKQWDLMEQLFTLDIRGKDMFMINNMIRILMKVVDASEEFSDELNTLALKYLFLD
ncbi:MAG: DUF47 family protein [Candidatus Hodarchaeota archaeon]